MPEIETWKDIPNHIGQYQASNLGRIKSLSRKHARTERVLKPYHGINGYWVVCISGKPASIHRLIAITFILNPENKPCVNHIDGKPVNNNLMNLEWCTYKENTQHAIKMGSFGNIKGKNHSNYGKKHSDETRKKMSLARNGKENPMKGRKHSDETKKQMSDARKLYWKQKNN